MSSSRSRGASSTNAGGGATPSSNQLTTNTHHPATGPSPSSSTGGGGQNPSAATGAAGGATTATATIITSTGRKGGASTIESLGERVFLTSPRMFSFSHRTTTSIRHPFVPIALATLNAEAEARNAAFAAGQTNPKRGGGGAASSSGPMTATAKAERMSEYFAECADEEKWRAVAKMLDSVLFEKDISHRRQSAIENATLRRALETWWCKAGGTPTRGISEESYKQIHSLLYRDLLNVNDVCMHGIITKSISQDWQWDSAGRGEVDFGRWYMSLLEIADNYLDSCDGEKYGQFLVDLAKRVLPQSTASQSPNSASLALQSATPAALKSLGHHGSSSSPNGANSSSPSPSSRPDSWALDGARRNTMASMLHRNARLYRSHKLIQKHWTPRHTVLYSSIPESALAEDDEGGYV
ncbi:Hypothetical protein, putative [Bodo saltans]|uniref:Uncharacterized protein n=1 Tax=Bodo saltans TaxID=75058 RepID=A0A0S4J551_BODSA|nr:Hypothetical protein, putative [Bodo saltans]|eukprot:CUG80339.1 Hypothetical protein, putative [Bodo saltans]